VTLYFAPLFNDREALQPEYSCTHLHRPFPLQNQLRQLPVEGIVKQSDDPASNLVQIDLACGLSRSYDSIPANSLKIDIVQRHLHFPAALSLGQGVLQIPLGGHRKKAEKTSPCRVILLGALQIAEDGVCHGIGHEV